MDRETKRSTLQVGAKDRDLNVWGQRVQSAEVQERLYRKIHTLKPQAREQDGQEIPSSPRRNFGRRKPVLFRAARAKGESYRDHCSCKRKAGPPYRWG